MSRRLRTIILLVIVAFLCLAVACGGPDAKKLKFYNKGKELYDKGDYVKANLEFRNAIQIDPQYADPYYMLGMIAIKNREYGKAMGSFSRAVELNPQLWNAHIELGKLNLAMNKIDETAAKVDLVMKNDPKNEDAMVLKGALLVRKNGNEAARNYIESILGRELRKPEGYMLLGLICRDAKDFSASERALQDGIKANGRNIALHLTLTDLYLNQKQWDKASTIMQKIIEIEPKVDQHRLAYAGILWTSGKEPQARDILRAFLSEESAKEERWIAVANFYGTRGELAETEKILKEGIEKNRKSFTIRFALSDFYAARKQDDKTLALLQECLTLEKDSADPNIIQAKTNLARFHFARREFEKTKTYVDDVIKENPKSVDGNYLRGNLNLLKGDGTQAIAAFRTVVGERPQWIPGYIGLADAHMMNKEVNLANDTLQKALKMAPADRDLGRALARYELARQNVSGAKEWYRGMVEQNPNDFEVRLEFGDVLQRNGEYTQAEAQYREVKRRVPNYPYSYLKLSALYMREQKWSQAAAELDKLVSLYPDLWSPTNDLAFLLADYGKGKKDLDRALQLVEKAQSLKADDPNVLDTCGWVHYRRGEYAEAIEWLSKARAKAASSPIINYHLGMASMKAGQSGKAREYLQVALSSKTSFPGRAEAEKTLAIIR